MLPPSRLCSVFPRPLQDSDSLLAKALKVAGTTQAASVQRCGGQCAAAELSGHSGVSIITLQPTQAQAQQQLSRPAKAQQQSVDRVATAAPPDSAYVPLARGSPHVPVSLKRSAVPGTRTGAAFDFTGGGNQWVKSMMHSPSESCDLKRTLTLPYAAHTYATMPLPQKPPAASRTRKTSLRAGSPMQ